MGGQTCAELGVHVTAYSPLGSPDSAASIKHGGAAVLAHPAVAAAAAATGHTPGQALIRWALQRGTSVVPKLPSMHGVRIFGVNHKQMD